MISVLHSLWRDESLAALVFGWLSRVYVFTEFVCTHVHSIYVCFLIWTNTWVCAGHDAKLLECEPDVTEHRPLAPPPSSIPWDRNKEARLHQAGLWSAQLYRLRISNWQPSDRGCFLCNLHMESHNVFCHIYRLGTEVFFRNTDWITLVLPSADSCLIK